MSHDDLWMFGVIIGLSVVTVVARSFFFYQTKTGNSHIGRNEDCNTRRLRLCPQSWCQKL